LFSACCFLACCCCFSARFRPAFGAHALPFLLPLALADNVNIEMNLDPRIFTPTCPTADIVLYGRNKNLLRYKFGMLSKKFA
jgi:hypothetical protein